jgi:hypothetical protein
MSFNNPILIPKEEEGEGKKKKKRSEVFGTGRAR